MDKVAYQGGAKDITRDNAVILTNAIAFIKVHDPVKGLFGRKG